MTGRRDDVALGSSMRIIVPEAAIHLFDRESGERLSTGR
jgi:multiple sugar transport system ATP-binding protein